MKKSIVKRYCGKLSNNYTKLFNLVSLINSKLFQDLLIIPQIRQENDWHDQNSSGQPNHHKSSRKKIEFIEYNKDNISPKKYLERCQISALSNGY